MEQQSQQLNLWKQGQVLLRDIELKAATYIWSKYAPDIRRVLETWEVEPYTTDSFVNLNNPVKGGDPALKEFGVQENLIFDKIDPTTDTENLTVFDVPTTRLPCTSKIFGQVRESIKDDKFKVGSLDNFVYAINTSDADFAVVVRFGIGKMPKLLQKTLKCIGIRRKYFYDLPYTKAIRLRPMKQFEIAKLTPETYLEKLIDKFTHPLLYVERIQK